jgi:hypothetical protein
MNLHIEKKSKTFAKAISIAAHPVFIFPLLTSVYFDWEQIESFLVISLLSFVLPFFHFLYLYKKKKVSNFDVSERKQRYPLYASTFIGLTLSLIYLNLYSTEEIFYDFARLMLIAVSLILVNFKIKVSIHTALITLLCLSLVKDFNVHPLVLLLIPFVMASRYFLKRHSAIELLLGLGIPVLFYSLG